MKPLKYFFLIFISVTIVCLSSLTVNSISSSDCSDYEFIFARGSGQSLGDVDFRVLREKLEDRFRDDISYNLYELGSVSNGYPAYNPDGLFSILGTYISAGESYKFGESVEKGTEELISRVRTETKKCRDKRFVLVGYSQGAFVVNKALPYLNSEKLLYVASFGDPKLNLPEGKNKNACKNIGLSSYRVYVPDCEVEEGVLGGKNPYEPKDLKNKRGAWCSQNDFICGSSLNIFDIWKGHTSYVNENGYEKLVEIVSEKIKNVSKIDSETEARYSDYKKRNIIVLYDYSDKFMLYSCASCESISSDIKKVLVEQSKRNSKVAVYNYYALANSSKHLEEMIPLTNENLDEKIDAFNLENSLMWYDLVSAGGDNMYYAVKEISNNGKWEEGAERNIYIIRNNIKSSYRSFDKTTLDDAIDAAKANNVKVYILNYGGSIWAPLRELAEGTGGEAIGADLERIALNKSEVNKALRYSSKSFDLNQNSKYTLVIINDLIYGLSDKDKIIVKDIDEERENRIVLIPFDDSGKPIEKEEYIVGQDRAAPPDSGALKL